MAFIDEQNFIVTEQFGKSGETGELKVWEAVRQAFSSRECLGYWKYPIFSKSGHGRKEPDILIADRNLGLVVIEVKSIHINQVKKLNGHRWEFENFYTKYGNPYEQAEDQLYALLNNCNAFPEIRNKITGRVLVALPYITEAEWKSKGFDRLPSCPPIIFKDQLGKASLLNKIESTYVTQSGEELIEERWELLLSILSGAPLHIKQERKIIGHEHSRSAVIAALNKSLYEFDLKQERAGKTIPPGAQRIRGIAGSGKTVLLAQKAAHMHLKHPDWDIALVFFTRSLYDSFIAQVDKWLRHFSNGETCYDEIVKRKIKVLHAWGAKDREGFYRFLCRRHGIIPKKPSDLPSGSPSEKFAYACTDLLKNSHIYPVFDAVLIDEAQDLVVGDHAKYNGKQPFYWLAFQSLHPINESAPYDRRLIWAYDESQSLDSLKVPTSKELFGNDKNFSKMVSGLYSGGIKKSEIMQRCYRTLGPILTAAHAIGMGLLRDEGMLRGLTTRKDWEGIGYEVQQGSFRSGEEIVLHRPKKNSPNLIPYQWKGDVLQFQTYDSREAELNALTKSIKENIENDKLNLSRDILIITLGEGKTLQKAVSEHLMKAGINIYIPGALEKNYLFPKWPKENRDKFWEDDAITISQIHRAKGNEAHVIYVVGFDLIASKEDNIQLRNQLFVALTRTRGWATLTGIQSTLPMYDEMRRVIESGNTFKFTFKRPPIHNVNEEEENYITN
ncbi:MULTISPECIES: DEAD/DEAH box helicase [Bacillus]|uniref:DNA/RNA helicase n=1 Tax=Bacillus cereus TaxID=1396 RepID=A0A9X6B902_BACCE|nr:nuclease-related domain-containing DEAD/DEAH box helicase [Bacillus cereus]OOR74124.1 DNA/RNA helicase [Bacillus cereus]